MIPTITTMMIPATGSGTRMHAATGEGIRKIMDVCVPPLPNDALEEVVVASLDRVGIILLESRGTDHGR